MQHGCFYLAVWGCQMNVYDAGCLRSLMLASGFAEVSSPREAEVVILITCAVRAKPENKVINQLAAWKHQGQISSRTIIALGGCIGSEYAEELLHPDRGISIVFGPATAHRLPELISRFRTEGQPLARVSAPSLEKFSCIPPVRKSGPAAFVTIMEGCSNKCTYCIVPYTRGAEVSRPLGDILKECRAKIAAGALEIHLLGQNVNSYRGDGGEGGECDFASLLYEVAALPGLGRLRFTTSNPMEFSDDIIRAVGELPVIADSIHIPVQSGSDRILQRMHRRYTAASYLELAAKLRQARPGVLISSDFIVGFPGETASDFEDTLKLVNAIKFDQSFSFIYSKRPGTPASEYADPVTLADKKQRLYRLQQRLEELAASYSRSFVGTVQRVLVEGISKRDPGELRGRTSSNRIVVFRGEPDKVRGMAEVKITGVAAHTLKGELAGTNTSTPGGEQ